MWTPTLNQEAITSLPQEDFGDSNGIVIKCQPPERLAAECSTSLCVCLQVSRQMRSNDYGFCCYRTETFFFYKTKDLSTLSLTTCMCEAAVLTQTYTHRVFTG